MISCHVLLHVAKTGHMLLHASKTCCIRIHCELNNYVAAFSVYSLLKKNIKYIQATNNFVYIASFLCFF